MCIIIILLYFVLQLQLQFYNKMQNMKDSSKILSGISDFFVIMTMPLYIYADADYFQHQLRIGM